MNSDEYEVSFEPSCCVYVYPQSRMANEQKWALEKVKLINLALKNVSEQKVVQIFCKDTENKQTNAVQCKSTNVFFLYRLTFVISNAAGDFDSRARERAITPIPYLVNNFFYSTKLD